MGNGVKILFGLAFALKLDFDACGGILIGLLHAANDACCHHIIMACGTSSSLHAANDACCHHTCPLCCLCARAKTYRQEDGGRKERKSENTHTRTHARTHARTHTHTHTHTHSSKYMYADLIKKYATISANSRDQLFCDIRSLFSTRLELQ